MPTYDFTCVECFTSYYCEQYEPLFGQAEAECPECGTLNQTDGEIEDNPDID